jgi:GAF domain-containing protein
MQESVDLLVSALDLYYVGLYVLNETSEWAVLRAGTGQAGREMRVRAHRLPVDEESMVGQCIAEGRAQLATDMSETQERGDRPWLPHARSALVLPMLGGDSANGALVCYSTSPSAFDEHDAVALQPVVDLLASAIETRRALMRHQDELQHSRALREIEIQLRKAVDRNSLLTAAEEALRGALQRPVHIAPVLPAADPLPGGYPVEVGGRTVATVVVSSGESGALSRHERTLVHATSQELADALARLELLERASTRAGREREIRGIVAKIEQAPDLDSLMRIAADELARALHASSAYVQMGGPDDLLGR